MRIGIFALFGFCFWVGCKSGDKPRSVLDTLPLATAVELDMERAASFVGLSIACVDREFPNKPSHIYDGASTFVLPLRATPAFFGCFDWHSAVHGHWAMTRILRLHPDLPEAESITAALDAHLTEGSLGQELTFFKEERSQTFERPYGWGWLFRLAAELHMLGVDQAVDWRFALGPLVDHLKGATLNYLNLLTVPVREGTHANTAFAMAHMADYASIVGDQAFKANLEKRGRELFLNDRHCPTAYEPSGEDFISPCLAEADLMRRFLTQAEFRIWLDNFLPAFESADFAPLLHPVEVRDLKDPRIGHLIGLSFHRAWCFLGIAKALPADDPRIPILTRLAHLHQQRGVTQMFDSGYGGEHWLASFAIMALTGQ